MKDTKKFTPLHDHLFVVDMEEGMRKTKGGIILGDDNFKEHGIRPRWSKVYAKGPKCTTPVEVGEWVLVEHGRWTLRMTLDFGEGEVECWKIDPAAIIVVSDEYPGEECFKFVDQI